MVVRQIFLSSYVINSPPLGTHCLSGIVSCAISQFVKICLDKV